MSAHGKLAWLLAVAFIDGTLDDKEAEMLVSFAKRNGLGIEDIDAVRRNHRHYLAQVPSDSGEKRQFFRELWLMLAADGKMADSEKNLVAQLGSALGISAEEARNIITGQA